jgi:hypothetical protein
MTAETSPPTADAWSIFMHTRSAITSAQYPWRVDYTIAISGLDGSRPTSDHYRASCDPAEGAIRVSSISDEQLQQPSPIAPHGFNFFVQSHPVGHPAPYQDLIGEPLIAPTYMFGLRYEGIPFSTTPITGTSGLPLIATVSTEARDYQVSFVDIEQLGNVETYHLRLRPVRKPKDYRLRELWVGTSDFLPRKAILSGNFTIAPLVDVPWTVDFSVIDGAPFIVREAADQTLYLSHKRVVRDTVISFESIREPSASIYDQPLIEPRASASDLTEPEQN